MDSMALDTGVKVRGFFHVQIMEGDEVKGDSGWQENQITNVGFNEFLVSLLGAIAGSKQITHMAIGTGTAPNATHTTLDGEQAVRAAVTAATSSTSKALQLTATFASAASFVTGTKNVANLGLFNSSAAGAMFAGNTFASSSCATNQNVNATYTISFT